MNIDHKDVAMLYKFIGYTAGQNKIRELCGISLFRYEKMGIVREYEKSDIWILEFSQVRIGLATPRPGNIRITGDREQFQKDWITLKLFGDALFEAYSELSINF